MNKPVHNLHKTDIKCISNYIMPLIKYTEQLALAKIEIMHNILNDDESIVFINELFTKVNIYPELYHLFKTKYKHNLKLVNYCKIIDSTLEQRLITGALHNKLHAGLVVFILKNKYNYTDKAVIDNNIIVTPILGGASNVQAIEAGKHSEVIEA
jgi:hypothetical protein